MPFLHHHICVGGHSAFVMHVMSAFTSLQVRKSGKLTLLFDTSCCALTLHLTLLAQCDHLNLTRVHLVFIIMQIRAAAGQELQVLTLLEEQARERQQHQLPAAAGRDTAHTHTKHTYIHATRHAFAAMGAWGWQCC